MSKVILLLGLPLVLLGFLLSTTMNMYNDAYALNTRNEELRQELESLRITIGILRQENDDLRAENARQRQELEKREGANAKTQIIPSQACSPAFWQALLPEPASLAAIFPFSASFMTLLVAVGYFALTIIYRRRI